MARLKYRDDKKIKQFLNRYYSVSDEKRDDIEREISVFGVDFSSFLSMCLRKGRWDLLDEHRLVHDKKIVKAGNKNYRWEADLIYRYPMLPDIVRLWVCPNGHNYIMPVGYRIFFNLGCPYCNPYENARILPICGLKYGCYMINEYSCDYDLDFHYDASYGDGSPSTTVIAGDNNYLSRDHRVGLWGDVTVTCKCGSSKCMKMYQFLKHKKTSCGPNCLLKKGKLPSGSSFPEAAIFYYVKQYYSDAIYRYRTSGYVEFDVYIPSAQTAIEYNGSFYHSNSHNWNEELKIAYCKNESIDLICITEGYNDDRYDHQLIRKEPYDSNSLNDIIVALLAELKIENVDIDVDREKDEIISYAKMNMNYGWSKI